MSAAGALTRAAAAVAPRLSFPVAAGLGRGLGSLAWAIDGRHRQVAVDNLRRAFPRLPESRCRQIALRSFQQAGRTAVEMLWSPALNDDTLPRVATFEGMEHLDAALAASNGALITTAHYGNWELMGVALAHVGVPMNVIARRLDDDDVEDVLHRLRTRTGAAVIHKDDAVRGALRALREGKVVGVLIDQNTIATQASFVPFFGRSAATTRISAQLHLRTGAPVVMLFCVPEQERYRFVIEPLEDDGIDRDAEDAVEQITAAATRHIERHVRRCPEAWLWLHDRWRTQPPATAEATTGAPATSEPTTGEPPTGRVSTDGPTASPAPPEW